MADCLVKKAGERDHEEVPCGLPQKHAILCLGTMTVPYPLPPAGGKKKDRLCLCLPPPAHNFLPILPFP